MGLLAKAAQKDSGNQGLLEKATLIRNAQNFSLFCKNNGFLHCGIFTRIQGMYVISHGSGLSIHTILQSISSEDYWDSALSDTNSWLTVNRTDENWNLYSQLFSLEEREKVLEVSLVRLNGLPHETEDKILMAARWDEENIFSLPEMNETFFNEVSCSLEEHGELQEALLAEAINSGLRKGADQLPLCGNMFILSCQHMLEKALASVENTTEQLKSFLNRQLSLQFYRNIASSFALPEICITTKENEVKLILFTEDEVDQDLLSFQLKQILAPEWDEFAADLQLFAVGIADNSRILQGFIHS